MAILRVKQADGTWAEIPALLGEKGDKGDPGTPGADGKTPVKGTDYFTEAEKAQMVADVTAGLATIQLVGIDENDVQHTWTLYGKAN